MKFIRNIGNWFGATFRPGGLWFNAFFILLAAAVVGFGIWITVASWEWLQGASSRLISDSAAESNSTTLRNVGLLIGGALALVFALWRSLVAGHQADTSRRQAEVAQEQIEIAQQGLLNERYQKGAEMLSNDVLSVRLGGIYALRRLAEEHPEQYHVSIMRLLSAFARHPIEDDAVRSNIASSNNCNDKKSLIREDVQAAMNAICACHEVQYRRTGETERYLDFYRADLNGIRLRAVILTVGRRSFRGTLAEAFDHSSGADFTEAQLCSADLSFASLPNAEFKEARLCGTELVGANLSGAKFWEADMSGTSLSLADLTEADFWNANLHEVDFSKSNLSGARFANTGYPGIAELRGLTQAQLDEARADPENPPLLDNVLDAETGEPLMWRGKALEEK